MPSSNDKDTLETILVVDDNDLVVKTVVGILEAAGFRVLHADSGANAIALAASYAGRIDLLLSDVQMPVMAGPELGERLLAVRPEIRVMFMSGFADGDMLVLNYGWAFIQKPFLSKKLVEMIDGVLHTPNKSQGMLQYDARKSELKPE